jgi:hypothetical protein
MGLITLLSSKNKDSTQHQLLPPIPPFVKPAAAAQTFLALLLVYEFRSFIPTRHVLFCTFYPAYLILANRYRFGNNLAVRKRPEHHPNNISAVMSSIYSERDTVWFKRYMTSFTIVGVLLPLQTVFTAPPEFADAAISHLLVLWTQITCETVTMQNPFVHRYIALLIPLGFSVYRQSLLLEWFSISFTSFRSSFLSIIGGNTSLSWYWHALGFVLSSINLIIWTMNLFGFLLMRWTPEFLAGDKCKSPEIKWEFMVPHIQYANNGLKNKSSSVSSESTKTVSARAA